MEGFDVAGLLDAGYAAPSMAPMATPSMTTSMPSGLLSSGEAVTAPTSTRGMYNLLGDVPFSVDPRGKVYTPPPVPQFSFPFFGGIGGFRLPTFGPLAGLFGNIGAYGSPF